jgi:hypothetical protein
MRLSEWQFRKIFLAFLSKEIKMNNDNRWNGWRPQLPPRNLIFFDRRRQLWRRKRFTERRRRILVRHGWEALVEELCRVAGERFDMRGGRRLPKN